MKNLVIYLISIVLSVSLLSGCGNKVEVPDEPKVDESVAVNFMPQDGGTVTLQMRKSESLCPIYVKSLFNTHVLNLIYERLFYCESDMTATPCLAQGYSVASNGLVWTVTLKNNVTWHDGTPFTAEDAEYTINQIKADGKDNQYYQCVDNIAKVKVIDNSLEITLSKPRSNFANLLYFPVIKKQTEKINKNDYVPVGTGAFVYNAADNDGFTLTKNLNWHKGKTYLDNFKIVYIPDNSNTSMFSFSSKDTDMLISNDINWNKNINTADISVADIATGRFNFLGFNMQNSVLKAPEVRRAIAYAINRQKIVENILYGHGTASLSIISPTWKLFSGDLSAPSYDVKKANQLLIEGEWQLQNEVFEKKVAGKTQRLQFELLINDDNPIREQVAAFLQKNLMDAGIVVNIKKVSFNEYTSLVSRRKYDMFLGEYDVMADLDFRFMLNSNSNVFGNRDADMDKILDKMQSADSTETAAGAYSEFQEKFYEQLPFVGLYYRNSVLLYNNRIKGMPKPLFCDVYRGVESLYILE